MTVSGITSRSYPYPGDTDDPDVPSDIKALADAINTDVQALVALLGGAVIELQDYAAAGSFVNFEDLGGAARKFGGAIFLSGGMEMPTGHSLADGATIATLPAAFRPANARVWVPVLYDADTGTQPSTTNAGVVPLKYVTIGTDGVMKLAGGLASEDGLFFTGCFTSPVELA